MKPVLKYHSADISGAFLSIDSPTTKDIYNSHIHNDYELLFFYDGDADYIIGGSIYHLQKNDLLLIKPAVYHHIRILSARLYQRIVLNFNESVLLPELVSFVRNTGNFFRVESDSPIKRIMDNLRDAAPALKGDEYNYWLNSSLNQILLNMKHFSSFVVKEKITSRSVLEQILLFIDENPTLPLSITFLAKKFNLSQSWIAHSFKNTLGVSPSQYINRKKITYAQSLIKMGISPVQAAEACGYVNYTTFYRQYKKYLGVSPAEDAKDV
ncbi:MAG: helix-turn-helix transcriptional regulator [Clostridia bacterium]|nr:helix-turn-helix transcriptional regulator [Clostridia bacterium]